MSKSHIKKIIHACGAFSILSASFFFMSVLILGLIQPGYNHMIDTISVLVLGKYGWVQQVNFIILAFGFGSLGVGLGLHYYRKLRNTITVGFLFLSLCMIFVLLFKADPVDRTQIRLTTLHSRDGLIHLSVTFIMVILIPIFFIELVKRLKTVKETIHLGVYTIWVIVLNVVFGLLWFYCRRYGIGFTIKGLWQKGLAVNVLIWMTIMGRWLMQLRIK